MEQSLGWLGAPSDDDERDKASAVWKKTVAVAAGHREAWLRRAADGDEVRKGSSHGLLMFL